MVQKTSTRLLAALTFATFTGLLSLGCGGGLDGTGPGDGGGGAGEGLGGGTMTATVDGVSWEADEVQATFDGGVLAFAGAQLPGGSENQQINITVPSAQLGMQSLTLPAVAIYSDAQSAAVEDISTYNALAVGTIDITALDDMGASGTFSFTGEQTLPAGQMGQVMVTNGTFDVTF